MWVTSKGNPLVSQVQCKLKNDGGNKMMSLENGTSSGQQKLSIL